MLQYETELTLGAEHVDCYGRWRPSAIYMAMQNAGVEHAELLYCGRSTLLARGLFWALFRVQLQMDQYPLFGEKVVIRTWPGKTNRNFYPRYHVFERPDGTRLGCASSLWLLVNVNTRSMALGASLAVPLPDIDLEPPLPYPERADLITEKPISTDYLPLYTDLDINGHVNNTKYVDWVCNLLPLEHHANHCISDLVVNYQKEILPQTQLTLVLGQTEDRFSVQGREAQGSQVFFEASGRWRPWKRDKPGLF